MGWAGHRGDFVAKTVAGITASLERAVFTEEQARLPGLLQGIDPRAKVAAALLLLVGVGLARHLPPVVAAYVVTVLLGLASRLPLGEFSRRVWLGIPLFAGFVAFPSLVMLPGAPLLVLWGGPPLPLVVTDNGLASVLLFVSRVGTSVAIALLLVTTTRWTDLLAALRVLRVPESFLVVLAMTYRYLFLFLRSANSLFQARASRTVGETSGAEQRRWAAAAAGTLASRSMKMSTDVLLAMEARGFGGEIRSSRPPRMRDGDRFFLALSVVLAAGLLLADSWMA
ncbi:MAG: cobalt ECF transporter T component CbiQ [Sphingomonadaceae bacterium]